MKRRIDEIPVSERLDEAVAIGLNRAKFVHRRRLMKKSLAIAASIAIALTAFLTWGFSNPVLASQIPFIGHIFAQNEEHISFPGNYSDMAVVLDTEIPEKATEEIDIDTEEASTETSSYTVHDAGYSFTVNEIYSDGSSVYLGITVKADKGFGDIQGTATERYGETTAQTIDIMVGTFTIYGDEKIELFIPNSSIEGTQISNDTLEGILKVNLQDNILPQGKELTAELEINGIIYNAPNSPDLVPGVSYLCGDWKVPAVPFVINNVSVDVYQINDISEDGFGIGTVIVTPYEIKVEYILPSRYATKEELIAAKREYAEEDGIGMTDEEIDAFVPSAFFSADNYGPSIYDANGKALEFQEENASKDGDGWLATYSVRDADISTLHFYIGEGDHETIKETDQAAIEARAVYKYTIDTNLE